MKMTDLTSNTKFIILILVQAILWTAAGIATGLIYGWPLKPFLLIMGAATVALFLLIRLIKILLDTGLPTPMKIVQFVLFSFFKFLCLAFLAITLKRFQELPFIMLMMGATFYWMAPVVAGLLCSKD